MTDFIGTKGDDSITGTAEPDTFDLSQGGQDTAIGGGGNDVFNMGGAFTARDQIIGGDGNDLLVLDGDYSRGVAYSTDAMSTIERVAFEAGHDYRLTVSGSGAPLVEFQSHIGVGDHLMLDGRNVTAESGLIYEGGVGSETVLGSAGLDEVYMSGLTAEDRIDGGDGDIDHLYLNGDFSAGVVMRNSTLQGFEFVKLTAGNDYDLTFAKTTVDAAGMQIDAHMSGPDDTVRIDASRSLFAVSINSGRADDTLIGSGGGDTLSGGKGADGLTGGAGADHLSGGLGGDHFFFGHASDSTAVATDLITDLQAGDVINLKHVDADVGTSGNQAFHLVGSLDGHAGELAVSYDAGSDLTSIQGDVDGDGVADLVITATGDQTGFTGFAL